MRWRYAADRNAPTFQVTDPLTVYGGGVKHAGSSCRVSAVSGCDVSLVRFAPYRLSFIFLGSAEEEGEYEEEVQEGEE
jgi:hypothetical protein